MRCNYVFRCIAVAAVVLWKLNQCRRGIENLRPYIYLSGSTSQLQTSKKYQCLRNQPNKLQGPIISGCG